jgi:Fe-S-cluster containining protein
MARLLFEMSCLEGLDLFSQTGVLPTAFFRSYRKVVGLYDESTQYFLGYLRRRGLAVRCEPGCAHCCNHMPAGISGTELLFLYHGMHRTGQFSRLFRRCLEARELLAETALCQHREAIGEPPGGPLRDRLLHSYAEIRQPCPFLRDNRCQVYGVRPLACRMHFSLSPPGWCRPDHFQYRYAVRFNLEPGECVYRELDRLDRILALGLCDLMVCGVLELTVNKLRFASILCPS